MTAKGIRIIAIGLQEAIGTMKTSCSCSDCCDRFIYLFGEANDIEESELKRSSN